MTQINIQSYETCIGELLIGSFNQKLCLLDYRYRKTRGSVDRRIQQSLKADYVEQNDDVIESAKQQINEYLDNTRMVFDLPLLMVGTEFQKRVWGALTEIPYGKTSSYLSLAKKINNEKAVRAVAGANGANAISIIIPCHRIIGSDGSLTGYAGGLEAKKHLLNLESNNTLQTRSDNSTPIIAFRQKGLNFT